MTRILTVLFTIFIGVNCYAATVTDNYELVIPAEGDRNWQFVLSDDIVSIDRIMGIISDDATWTTDGTYTYIADTDLKCVVGGLYLFIFGQPTEIPYSCL